MSILRYKADLRTLTFIGIYFMLAYTSFVFWDQLSVPAIIALCLTTCFFCFVCAVIVHNTIHAPMFRKKRWNRVTQYILSVAYGYSVSAYVPGHNFSHHKEMQSRKDMIRTSKMRFRWNFLNQALFFFVVVKDIVPDEMRFAKKMKKDKPAWYRQYMSEIILVNIVKFGLLIINWKAALVFIWLPQLYAVWGVLGTNMWQHDGTDEHHPYNHSRSIVGSLTNYFCFNNGYHGAHHDKPSLHWSLLPAYHEKHIAPHLHPNLQLNSLLAFLWKQNIWPGKRVDYLGNAMSVPEKTKDLDWIAGLNTSSAQHKEDYGGI